MNISKEEIIHIAKLACLNLSEEEIAKYTHDMEEIIGFANIIKSIDTSGLDESIGAFENYNVFRKDEIKTSYPREEMLKNAPSTEDGYFHLPKVIN